jgi:hypothetical protein
MEPFEAEQDLVYSAVDDVRLSAAADGWLALGLASTPADRPAAEQAVHLAYARAGLPAPERVEWHASPLAGAQAAFAATTEGSAGASVRVAVRTRPWASVRAEVARRLGPVGWSRHWAASGARTWELLGERLVGALRTRLTAELGDADGEQRTDSELATARLVLLDAVHGQHDAAWLGAFVGPAGERLPGIGDTSLVDGIAGVARSAGWWWPYERVAILTERPTAVHRDNLGRLHHGDGPALSYPDGWGLHAWRGMPIPAAVAQLLPHLTVEQIRAEDNAEIRRVMLEHFGYDRYLRASGAREVHRDETGILWHVDLPGDEPLVMVEVVNATPEPDGTRRTYFLRVPPSTRTARAGVAWTFGLTEEEYRPLRQT